jgi:hypothetical protein
MMRLFTDKGKAGRNGQLPLADARCNRQRKPMDENGSSLDDPDYARFAWARYRRVMKWMLVPAIGAALAALAWMHVYGGGLTIPVALATALGVGLTVLMAAALMGLIFLSSGSGHDDDVDAQGQESLKQSKN